MKLRNQKIIGVLLTISAVICLILSFAFTDRLNSYLSTFSIIKSEGESKIQYYSSDHSQVFELAPGSELVLPIHIEKQLFRIGVYMEEQRDGEEEYVFQVEDEYGSIIGKTVIALDTVVPGNFVYINTSRSVLNVGKEYYIKIFCKDGESGKTALRLPVSNAASFDTAAFSLDGAEGVQTLVLDYRYQAVNRKPLIYINGALISVALIYWLIFIAKCKNWGKAWKKSAAKIISTVPWKKVNIAAICLLLVVNVILLFPRKTYDTRFANVRMTMYEEQVISMTEGKVFEQRIEGKGQIDSFRIFFATYSRTISGGTVNVELWNKDTETLVYSGSVKTEEISDNCFKQFDLSETLDVSGGKYSVVFWANYQDAESTVAVYLNDNYSESMYALIDDIPVRGSFVFKFDKTVGSIETGRSLVAGLLLLVLLILFVVKYFRFNRPALKPAIVSLLVLIILYLPIMSFFAYGELSMNAISSVLQNKEDNRLQYVFNEENLKKAMAREIEYDFAGEVHSVYERTELPVHGTLSDISIKLADTLIPKLDYNIQVYWDTGDGYNDKQSYTYRYIHKGGDTVAFSVPCNESVQKLLINIGLVSDRTIFIPERIFPMENVQINANSGRFNISIISLRSGFVLLCLFALEIIVYLWVRFKVDKKIFEFFSRKNITISHIFVAVCVVYGIFFSFLIPTNQVPDERSHWSMLYEDLGDPSKLQEIYDELGDQGQTGVVRYPGQGVDTAEYISAASNMLENYSFSNQFPSIKIVRRPGQALGVLIGQLLHLPAYWILQLGELGGLVVYAVLGAIALKLMPFKKNLMMAVMLLPMAIHQAASVSYDGLANMSAYLAIAYILHLKVNAEKVSWKQIVNFFILAVMLLLCKVVFVLLMFLVFTIPLDKLELKIGKFTLNAPWVRAHKGRVIVFLTMIAVICVCGAFTVLSLIGYNNILSHMVDMAGSLPQLIRLFVTTAATHFETWSRDVMCLMGNYDNPINKIFPIWIGYSLLLFAFMHHRKETDVFGMTEERSRAFSICDLILYYGVFLLTSIAIMMSMVSWGFFIYQIDSTLPYSVRMHLIPRIEGVQGRYFLPILPLLFIPLHTKKDFLKFIPQFLYKIFYYLIIIIYPVSVLLARYWGIGNL